MALYEVVSCEIVAGQSMFQARVAITDGGQTVTALSSNGNPVLASLCATLRAVRAFQEVAAVQFEIDGGEKEAKAVVAKFSDAVYILCQYIVDPPSHGTAEKTAKAFINVINHMNRPQQVAA